MNALYFKRWGKQLSVSHAHIGFLLAVLMLSACMAETKPPKPIYYYTFDYEPSTIQMPRQLPITLRVERFSVSPPFHTQRIIYAGKGAHRNAYAYHQWIATPGELLPYLFVRDLRKSNGFKAVLTPDASLHSTHSLHGWVEEFIEKDEASKWLAVATIHISLIINNHSDPTQQIIFQKRYHRAATCNAKTPEALAEAMGDALAKITAGVAKDIHHQLTSTMTLTY
ncbi:MAG: ABC-type transport auxiliary lipoprotein family protein [Desulfobacteraceae bacterium]|jgi:ABC-type uncharacterized transport system auxiliary subunit